MVSEEKEYDSEKFWNHAARYAREFSEDGPFVDEIAYVMVTLHRTSA